MNLPRCIRLTRLFYGTEDRPTEALRRQLVRASCLVQEYVLVELEPHQIDATVCLMSDVVAGLLWVPGGKVDKLPVFEMINAGMHHLVVDEFARLAYVRGKIDHLAYKKRLKEADLYINGHSY